MSSIFSFEIKSANLWRIEEPVLCPAQRTSALEIQRAMMVQNDRVGVTGIGGKRRDRRPVRN